MAEQIRDGLVSEIQAYLPEFDPDDPDSDGTYGLDFQTEGSHRTAITAHTGDTDTALTDLRTETDRVVAVHNRAPGSGHSVSETRRAVIKTYDDQYAFIIDKAASLRFSDVAQDEVQTESQKLRDNWTGTHRGLYASTQYTDLQKERKKIEVDRGLVECELQAYFDHHVHGASRSESIKPERTPLKLAPNLEQGKAGYKQVQNMDLFSLSRGNEMWAIIPELVRVGHDVDPISCMHWKPTFRSADLPQAIRKYRADQAAALAKRLLSLCSQGLKTKLLAEHKFGINKERFKASREDGVQLYWVMLMLFHPLSREYRRTLKSDIYAMPAKFSSGNPETVVEDIQEKLQEAMDMEVRLAWDQIGVPVIDTLSQRDPLFAVELAEFRDKPLDPDDSAITFEHMISHISTVIQTLNTAQKDWHGRRAKAAQATDQPDPELTALRSEVKDLKGKLTKAGAFKAWGKNGKGGKGGNPNPNQGKGKKKAFLSAGHPKGVPDGHCQAVGCGQKIDRWHKTERNWKICGTCLLKVKKTNQPLTLISGKKWGSVHHAKSLIGLMKLAHAEGLDDETNETKQAKAATKRARPGDPESPGGQEGDASDEDDGGSVRPEDQTHVEADSQGFSSATEQLFAGLVAQRDRPDTITATPKRKGGKRVKVDESANSKH